jgi:hypothetical protein
MTKKRNKDPIKEAFVVHTLPMRRSSAWKALPDHARRVLARLEDEHMTHGGAANGRLCCTYKDFEAAGVPYKAIATAIRQCVALGFVEITHQGTPSNSEFRNPSRYRLTYLYGRKVMVDGVPTSLRTDDWKGLTTAGQAIAALAAVTEMKSVPHVRRATTRKVRAAA